jgi:hypothetical protein
MQENKPVQFKEYEGCKSEHLTVRNLGTKKVASFQIFFAYTIFTLRIPMREKNSSYTCSNIAKRQ